jgi:hypothetical protein
MMTRFTATVASMALLVASCSSSPPYSHITTCGDNLLECTPTVDAQCDGPNTDVTIPAPLPCEDGLTITDDIPEDGFPVGETTVTFTATGAAGTESCTTVVTITDETPPDLQCEDEVTVVRTGPGISVDSPDPLSATDLCDDEVDVTAEPATVPYGTTTVTYTATDDSGLSSSCDTEVTVLDIFAVTGLRILSASINGDDSTTVTIGWDPVASADAIGLDVQRATEEDGPWESLQTLSMGQVLYTDPQLPVDRAYYRVVSMAGALEGGATDPVQAFAVTVDGYDLRDQSVPGVSFLTTLYGVVRHPTDLTAGPYPFVLLIHGNHGICRQTPTSTDDYCETSNDHDCHTPGWVNTPNAEGMAFQAETLAAQGYVAVSISANAMNCRNDYIPQRTQLVIEHLRRWKTWSDTGGDPFGTTYTGAVDMTRVGLVGHSRGGDAVSNTPLALDATPVSGVDVVSIFAIAPTDYHDTTPVDTHYAVLLPACDGDVTSLIGKDIYDRGLDPDDHSIRAQVFYIGANHNFFSTEWYYDDGQTQCSYGDLVGKQAQQGMLEATEGSWFNATLKGAQTDPFLRAEGQTPACIDQWAGTDLDLRWSYSAPERKIVDDFESAGAPDTNALGGANTFVDFTEYRSCYENGCDTVFDHLKDALYLRWDYATNASANLDLNGEDASAWSYLSFRVVSRWSTWNTGRVEQDFTMTLFDEDGHAAELLVHDVQPVLHLYPAYSVTEILQTVRIPLSDLTALNQDLDLDSLGSFELAFDHDGDQGSVLVTDVELAN